MDCFLIPVQKSPWNTHVLLNALARLKPDHACLMPAQLHQIGNFKKMHLALCQ